MHTHRSIRRLVPGAAVAAAVAVLGLVPVPAATATTNATAEAPAVTGADWVADGHDASNGFRNPAETAITPATVGSLTRAYTISLGDSDRCFSDQAPVVVGDRFFVVDGSGPYGAVVAYSAATGTRLWRHAFGAGLQLPDDVHLAYLDGKLFVSDTSCDRDADLHSTLQALDPATGRRSWVRTSGAPFQSLVAADGIVVVSGGTESNNNETVAYDATTGAVRWRDERYETSAALCSGLLLLHENDTVAAVDIRSGTPRWTHDEIYLDALACVPGGGSLVARRHFPLEGPDQLVSVDVGDGHVRWSADPGLVAVSGSTVFVAGEDQDGTVTAYRASDGTVRWSRASEATTNPVLAGGLLYVANFDTTQVLRAGTGTPVATVGSLQSFVHPVVSHGRVYLVDSSTGRLEVFTL